MTTTERATEPHRVQRSRQVKGSMLGAVYVGRLGDDKNGRERNPFANPYRVGTPNNPVRVWGIFRGRWTTIRSREDSVRLFVRLAKKRLKADPHWLDPLKGKNLACWCPLNQPCHADILLELANA